MPFLCALCYVFANFELLETMHMAGGNYGERIKLVFIDFGSTVDEYHTSLSIDHFRCVVCHH